MKKLKTYYLASKYCIFKNLVEEQIYLDETRIIKKKIDNSIKTYFPSKSFSKKELLKLKYDIAYCRYKYNITLDEYFWYQFNKKIYF